MRRTVNVPLSMPLLLLLVVMPRTTTASFATQRLSTASFVGVTGGSWSLQQQQQQLLRPLHQTPSSTTTEMSFVAATSKATTGTKGISGTTGITTTTAKDRLESLLKPQANDGTVTTSKPPPALVNVTLTKHRPLGCVVEESVAITNNLARLVFVASVSPLGHAAKAGIQLGDVIVGVSGLFQVESVLGQGIDVVYVEACLFGVVWCRRFAVFEYVRSHTLPYYPKTFYRSTHSKSLVASCPDSEPLQLQLLRGTTVVSDHEAALVELCANPDTSDAEAEQCMLNYLQGGYYNENDTPVVECNGDDEQECLLDNLQSMWADLNDNNVDMDGSSSSSQPLASSVTAISTSSTTKPWSSRSSPSGTFVRDPSTGQMRNIN
jgi:hypothetical protein